MDALIKIFRDKGYSVTFKNEFSYVMINGEEIKICIKEMMARVPVKHGTWETTDLVPTGLLSFRIKERYEEVQFKDGKHTIEEQLPKIIARLELESEKEKQQREERDKWHAEYEESRRIESEIQQRKEKEISDFKKLLEDAGRWHKSIIARNYLDMVEARANSNNTISEEQKEWLEWARKKIDAYDPLNNQIEN